MIFKADDFSQVGSGLRIGFRGTRLSGGGLCFRWPKNLNSMFRLEFLRFQECSRAVNRIENTSCLSNDASMNPRDSNLYFPLSIFPGQDGAVHKVWI